ncbi:MAG: heparinase II/III family protein, partial [Prevotella sp.]|nr:heparinase II/III family protein [Prevotella sp.]
GITNMVAYVALHHSRYSSANNHLIVEAAAVGIAGYAFGNEGWKRLATRILTGELPRQTYEDGVNKELSLHYHAFVMEAYCLAAHTVRAAGDTVPRVRLSYMERMAEYLSHATWREAAVCGFGDDDEGKILDLTGGEYAYFNYVLQFCSLETGKRYASFNDVNETVRWLFAEEEIRRIKTLTLYDNRASRCFTLGGNTFLRDPDDRLLIGIDHAALGFGTIAAHGHADALSFQVLYDGRAVFADPGTYIYHSDLPSRNDYRRTVNHNTLCVAGRDSSEMTGAFLWERKAECRLISFKSTPETDALAASHDGYAPNIHTRTFVFDKARRTLDITDSLTREDNWCATLLLGAGCEARPRSGGYDIYCGGKRVCVLTVLSPADKSAVEPARLSPAYGTEIPVSAIRLYGHTTLLDFTLSFI